MASLTRLRRRLTRWRRYVAHHPPGAVRPPGHDRAAAAVQEEQHRRWCALVYGPRPWQAADACGCVDCVGETGCCQAGPDGHPGPCVTVCDDCQGGGRCVYCEGAGCRDCGDSGTCPGCHGAGEHVDDVYPRVVTIDTGGLL